MFHGRSASPSLRQTAAALAGCPGLVDLSGRAASDDPGDDRLAGSFSPFTDSTTTRPATFLAGVVAHLARQVRQQGAKPGAIPAALGIQDSTFLRLSRTRAPWLPSTGGTDVPGVRVHVQEAPAWDLPDHVVITATRHNECQGFDLALWDHPERLAAVRGQTVVLALGYSSHRRFAQALAAGVHLGARRKADAPIRVEADRPIQPPLPGLPPGRITVHADQCVPVGSPNNRASAGLPGRRLVRAPVAPLPAAARQGAASVHYAVLTDRWDLTAVDVIQLSLWRWQIEWCFRWLKRHVRLLPWLGYSQNAITLTIWLAIVVHLLPVLAARPLGWGRRSPTLLRRILSVLSTLAGDLLPDRPPAPCSYQLAFPGWESVPAAPT
jgi:hypothetical protein